MKGMMAMVTRRDFRLSMERVAIIAGTLQPKPITMGMKLFPCRPILCMSLSTMNAALAMYPLSSIMEMKKYRIMMLGRNTRTLPTPAITPSTTRSFTQPSCIMEPTHSPNFATSQSIQSMGYWPIVNVAQKMNHSSTMKIGKAIHWLVTTASILSVSVRRGLSSWYFS